jgi:hypothetical protein
MFNKKKGEKNMTTCYECGEDVIYPNDAFDVIQNAQIKIVKLTKRKKDLTHFYIRKKENYLMI